MDNDTAESLRELLARTRPACNADGYPPEVRKRVSAWLRVQHAGGAGWKGLGMTLGITRTTARVWAAEPVRGESATMAGSGETPPSVVATPAFLPVEVVDAGPEVTAPGSVVLVSPHGYRVEGLGLDQLAALLERVG